MAQQPGVFEPPPTYVLPIEVNEATGKPAFSEIWLNWFVQLARVLSNAGGGGGGIFHNSTMGLQGGNVSPAEFFHLSEAQYNALVANLHNSLSGLQGGTAGEYYHLTAAQHTLAGTLAAGTYTPTLTNTTNVAASTAYLCQYLRVGSVVTVSGLVSIDPTAAALTVLNMSLPVASNFGATENCGGAAMGANGQGIAIGADATANNATFVFTAVSVANFDYTFSFTYQII